MKKNVGNKLNYLSNEKPLGASVELRIIENLFVDVVVCFTNKPCVLFGTIRKNFNIVKVSCYLVTSFLPLLYCFFC